VKKKSRSKSSAKAKPERKPKGKAKGAPKPKGQPKAKGAPKPPPVHPDPTETGDPGDPNEMYCGFVLQLYDHDMRGAVPAVYGGKLRKVIVDPKKPIKALVATKTGAGAGAANVIDQDTRMVAKLRRHLWALGFWVFPRVYNDGVAEPEESDTFDWRTEWAVREFQIAAAMPNVAVDDVNKKAVTDAEKKEQAFKGKRLFRLSQKANQNKLAEEPTGVVTADTAKAIKFWLDNNYRCPLVIQAMQQVQELDPAGKKPTKRKVWVAHTESLWRHDEVPHTAQRMFAWDFSGHYVLPSGRENEKIAVGRYALYSSWGGPASYPSQGQCWGEAQLSPIVLTGTDWGEMDEPHKSTFRAIGGVGSVECQGYLDSLNFYDNCHGSAGPCHWTMPKSDGSGGEYCGFIALFEAKYGAAFKYCFSDLGLWGPRWVDSTSNDGRPKVVVQNATYGGYVYTKRADGKFEQHPSKHRSFAETNWLRSWQWVYRLEMAARTCKEYRNAMWEYACLRIKGIRVLDQVHDWLPDGCKPKGGPRITVGDVVTSEQGMATLLRLHVRWSGSLSASSKGKKGTAKPILHDAIQRVIGDKSLKDREGHPLNWAVPPAKWQTEHEVALVAALVYCTGTIGSSDQKRTVEEARYWPIAVKNGNVVETEVSVGKEKKKRLVLAGTASWIPDSEDPADYASKDSRESFKFAG
jgi:hypothetical protein